MPDIEISRADVEQFLSRFSVVVRDGERETRHAVTMSRGDFERLGASYRTPEEFMRACFAFLLARESNEKILASFDVSQIATYFPEFEEIIVTRPPEGGNG